VIVILADISPALIAVEKVAVYLLMITAVVSLHEFGHYIVARRFGVHVKTFAIGFGRKLFALRSPRSGTTYQLNVLPLGGYCRLKREVETPESGLGPSPGLSKVSPIWTARSYDTDSLEARTPLQRIAIMVAGPAVSFLIAIPLMIIAYAGLGTAAPTVVLTAPGGPADRAGLRPGDRIAALRTVGDQSQADISTAAWWTNPHGPVSITYRHNTDSRTVVLTPVDRHTTNQRLSRKTLGLEVKIETNRLSIGDAIVRSGQSFENVWTTSWAGIANLLVRPRATIGQFTGPIGLARSSGQVQDYGWGSYFTFAAVISISLGIFNIVPVPALDGGQVAFVIIEILRGGKRVSQKTQQVLLAGGIVAILALFAVTTFHDLNSMLAHHKG
jgi:regulator of sigma E protease